MRDSSLRALRVLGLSVSRFSADTNGTKYGKGKHTTRSYLTHHTQRIALAASRHDGPATSSS